MNYFITIRKQLYNWDRTANLNSQNYWTRIHSPWLYDENSRAPQFRKLYHQPRPLSRLAVTSCSLCRLASAGDLDWWAMVPAAAHFESFRDQTPTGLCPKCRARNFILQVSVRYRGTHRGRNKPHLVREDGDHNWRGPQGTEDCTENATFSMQQSLIKLTTNIPSSTISCCIVLCASPPHHPFLRTRPPFHRTTPHPPILESDDATEKLQQFYLAPNLPSAPATIK